MLIGLSGAIIPFILALLAFARGAQFFVGVNTRVVPVFPDRGQAITPDGFDIHKRCLFNTEARFIVQHTGLAAFASAPCTRAGPSQRSPAMPPPVFIAPDQAQLPLSLTRTE